MNTDSPFSDTYATARDRFRRAAADRGCELLRYPIDARGPDGEELTIDVAVGPAAASECALVVSSGVHGVEGLFGSAVQLALLREWAALPPVRVVLIHGLNPFGFAWRRRTNEDNIDLNRNFLLGDEVYTGSPPGYANLDGLLNPKRPPSRWEPVTLKILLAVARHGMPALKEAIASGQYDFPMGLFFGGRGPSRAGVVVGENLDAWLGDARRVAHLDLHSGLGDWGACKLIVDHPLDDPRRRRFDRWFGQGKIEEIVAADAAGRTAYPVRGSFGKWCVSRAGGRDYVYAGAEFGTYPPPRVLAGLRAENQAHHWGRPGDASTERAKRRLEELFCPRDADWRAAVVGQSTRLVGQAINGLVEEPEAEREPVPA